MGEKKQPESIAETPAAYIVTMYLAIFRTSGRDTGLARGASQAWLPLRGDPRDM